MFWRYGIEAQAHDGCIGFRIVLAWNLRPNACPRSGVELNKLLEDPLGEDVSYRMKGKMAFVSAAAWFGR